MNIFDSKVKNKFKAFGKKSPEKFIKEAGQ